MMNNYPELPDSNDLLNAMEREALRLQVPPVQPGDHPPTCGDEGGGNFFPDPRRNIRLPLLRRLGLAWTHRRRRRGSPPGA